MVISLRYSYEKEPPSPNRRIGMAKDLLRETLDRLENGKVADIGFAEDAIKRVRTDRMEL